MSFLMDALAALCNMRSTHCPTTSDTSIIEQDFQRDEHIDIDSLHEIAQELRMDSPSPVNGIPTEIMAEIFGLVPTPTSRCSNELSKLRPWQSLTDVREAVPLTSVCRLWRQVALSTPALWSSFLDLGDSNRPPLWIHYAHRCTAGPLFVGILGVPSRETIALLQRECLRVQELYFYAPHYPKSQHDVLVDLMALSFPRLKICMLTAYTYEPTSGAHLAFAGGGMRKLALCGSFVPQLCPSLVHLNLFNKISVRADELLDFLAGSPRLQYLRMCEITTIPLAGESVGSGGAAPPRQIVLPALRKVRVTKAESLADTTEQDYFAYMRHVFSQISYPSECDVSISLIHQNDFLPLTNASLRGKKGTHAALYKTTQSNPGYKFSARAVDKQDEDRLFQCEFNIEYSEDSTAMGQSLITLFSSSELASLQRLWTTPQWVCKLLAAHVPLRNLCTLIIHDLSSGSTRGPIEEVVTALTPNAEVGVACPALKLLAVHCRVRSRDLAHLENPSKILAIRKAARLRMEAGYPLSLQILVYSSKAAAVLHYDDHGQLSLHEKDHDRDSGGWRLWWVFDQHWGSGALEDWANV
ncbi:hypothetical protein C8Q73DRAFT_669298 [Cubamyces lactineus]|nr:hypothetical protein C8Q73DRAFT_669298 [Cubamyces lactineus]